MEKYFKFLDDLRASGETNMLGGPMFLLEEFPELDKIKARAIMRHWLKICDSRAKAKRDNPKSK